MGAGASSGFDSREAALAAGKTPEEIDAWVAQSADGAAAAEEQKQEQQQPQPPQQQEEQEAFAFRKSHKGRLTRSNVFCRIRPFAAYGGHAETDEVQAKQLDGWGAASVSVATQFMFSKGKNTYDFPRAVFPPDATQAQVFAGVAPAVVDALTREESGCNVVMFAYGQTGTGKTHTMFGPDKSLASGATFDEKWGLFPRLVHGVFETLHERAAADGGNTKFVVTASGIEFYLTLAFDLLNANAPILIDRNHKPVGQTVVRFNDVGDLMPFLVNVRTNRTSRSTQMNSRTDDHDGSSRSHAALILTIRQLNVAAGKVSETRLTLMDLAGAERPDKPLKQTAKQKKDDEFITMLSATGGGGDMRGEQLGDLRDRSISTRAQAGVINFELTMLSAEVRKAGDSHRKGRKYSPPLQNCPDMIKFLGSCFTGKDLMALMVALSPSGNNGWETWFSCQYGKDLSKLSAPVAPVKRKPLDKALKAAEKKSKEAGEKLAKNLKATGGGALKYRLLMQCQAKSAEDELLFLKTLAES
jgi:hypothetical protein